MSSPGPPPTPANYRKVHCYACETGRIPGRSAHVGPMGEFSANSVMISDISRNSRLIP